MRTKTPVVPTDIRKSAPTMLTRSLRPVLIPHSAQGRVGSARAVTFGWVGTSARRFGR